MLAGLITGLATFTLMPKRAIHFVLFAAVAAAAVRLAGPQTVERFSTIFVDAEERDASAESRTLLWSQAISVMLQNPATGVGPGGWYYEAAKFGWPAGKQVHSTWLQNGAEGGLFGFVIYILFYLLCVAQMTRIAWAPTPEERLRPFLVTAARTVSASLMGYIVAAQFVTAWPVEMSYYLCLIGALVLKLRTITPPEITEGPSVEEEEDWEEPEYAYAEEPIVV
jgi:O-antigen ligase